MAGGSAIIGALRVVLGADTAAFEDGLKGASGKLDSFGSNAGSNLDSFASGVGKTAAVVGVAMAAAAAAIGTAIFQSIDKIDSLGKAAQKAGAPIEQFSALASSAGKVKISIDELANGMEKLAKNMVAVAGGGPVSDAGRAFQVLGINIKDASGNLKSSSAIISELADKFVQFRDGPEKTALAIALFGKAGAEMIPLLNQGSSALKTQAEEMANLGLIIDQKTYQAAEQFKKSLNSLNSVVDSVVLRITAGALPAMQALAKQFTEVAREAKNWEGTSFIVDTAVKLITTGFIGLGSIFSATTESFGVLVKAISEAATGKFSQAWETIKGGAIVIDNFKKTVDNIQGLWLGPTKEIGDYKDGIEAIDAALGRFAAQKPAAPIIANTAAIEKFVESTKKALAAQEAETQTVGQAAGAKEKLRVVLQGLEVATSNHIPKTDALRSRLDDLANSAQQSALKLAGAQLVFASKEPLVQYQTELNNTSLAMVAVGATAEQLARNQEIVAQKFGASWQNIGANIAGTAGALSQLTGTFAKENKTMGVLSKAFGISQAIINTQIAITKALATLPPPASYVAVGLAIAQGAAAIAAITAQSFAKGGSFMVPGGISGTDNKLVPLNLASGERVDITPANDVGRRGGGVSEIMLRVSSLRDILTGENLRDAVDALNAGHRDGYRLKVVAA